MSEGRVSLTPERRVVIREVHGADDPARELPSALTDVIIHVCGY